MNSYLLAAVVIGFVAGLRSMTAPAAIAWAARLGAIDLAGTPLHFMASPLFLALFSFLAVGELIADKLPFIPKRTAAAPLVFRIISGALCGACLSAHYSLSVGAVAGALAAIAGAFAGYYTRRNLVTRFGVRDLLVALSEDVLAIGLAILSVRLL
ncbi:MAG: DUF4126 family protein [Chthoniobacterales bacterium]